MRRADPGAGRTVLSRRPLRRQGSRPVGSRPTLLRPEYHPPPVRGIYGFPSSLSRFPWHKRKVSLLGIGPLRQVLTVGEGARRSAR